MIKQLLFILFITTHTAFGQSILSQFNGSQLNQTVFLSFTIDAGKTCNGIIIERSADDVNYQPVGEIPGICGSSFEPVNYTFIDSIPLPDADNYYRLQLGVVEITEGIRVYFSATDPLDFVFAPNPFHTYTQISFLNPLNKTVTWQLTDRLGRTLQLGTLKNENFMLYNNHYRTGVYFLRIALGEDKFQDTKLVID